MHLISSTFPPQQAEWARTRLVAYASDQILVLSPAGAISPVMEIYSLFLYSNSSLDRRSSGLNWIGFQDETSI
jgi:hypothetical protein